MKMTIVQCIQCGKETPKRPQDVRASKSGRFFCSQACYGASCRIVVLCIICGSEIVSNGTSKQSRKYCSHSCANIARTGIKYDGTRPRSHHRKQQRLYGLLTYQRGERCERCQYSEEPRILVVHHIIERAKGGSDDLDNLELLCPNCHAKHHLIKENPALVSRASLNLVT